MKKGLDIFTANVPRLVLSFAVIIILFINPDPVRAAEQIVLKISLNGVIKGDYFAYREVDGDILIRADDFNVLGIKEAPQAITIENERYVSLKSLAGATFTYDERALSLSIVVPASWLASRAVIDLYPLHRTFNIYYPEESSAFVNYSLRYSAAEPADDYAFGVVDTFGYRSGNLLFLSDSRYTKTRYDESFVRLMSSVAYENRDTLQRLLIGDTFFSSGDLGSAGNIGGISISKVFSMDPYFIRQPMMNISGAAALPSVAELYSGGRLIYRQDLQPGAFEIKNFNYTGGDRDIEVLIKDAFGNVQRIIKPYYFSDALLREGLHEYSYNLGFLRKNFGIESNQYGNPAFSAYHRYGLNNQLTVGFRADAGNNVVNVGPQSSFVLPKAGAFTVTVAKSRKGDDDGFASSFNHSFQTGRFFTRLYLQNFSRLYATLSDEYLPGRIHYGGSVGAGYQLTDRSSVSADFTDFWKYEGDNRQTASLTYHYSQRGKWLANYFLTLRSVEESNSSFEFFVGVSLYPRTDTSLFVQHHQSRDQHAESIQYQKNMSSRSEGYGYRASLDSTAAENGSTTNTFNPFLQYNGPYGIYTAEGKFQTSADVTTEFYDVSASGAVVLADKTIGFSRPVNNSFGIVQVGDIKDATVFLNGVPAGKTGSSGKVVIPEMSAYQDNQISVNGANLPMDYRMSDMSVTLSPSVWSGSCIRFDVVKFHAVVGTVYMSADDKKKYLEMVPGILKVNGTDLKFQTGMNGEFYIENILSKETGTVSKRTHSCSAFSEEALYSARYIKPGIYHALVNVEGITCGFDIAFSETGDVIADLGEIQCVITRVSEPARPVQERAAPEAEKPASLSQVKSPAPDAGTLAVKANDKKPLTLIVQLPFDKEGYPANKKDVKIISNILRRLSLNPNLMIEIETHCDRRGSDAVNMKIGMKRSLVIKKYLILSGVPEEKIIKTITSGKRKPICKKPTDECNTKNRRGIIRLVAKGGNGDVTQVESHY